MAPRGYRHPMPGVEWSLRRWLLHGVTVVLWSVALAATAAYAWGEPFTATLVLTFVALFVIIHAVIFVTVRVLDRIGRS